MSRERRTCSVVLGNGCRAPANMSHSTRATCYRCGEPVCTTCSTLARTYYPPGRPIRICYRCAHDEPNPDTRKRILDRILGNERNTA